MLNRLYTAMLKKKSKKGYGFCFLPIILFYRLSCYLKIKFMPFEIRILDKINPFVNLVDFGRVPEPLITLNSNFHPKSIGLIELEIYGKYFNIGQTWFVEYDNLHYKFFQSLIINVPHTDFGDLYLIGTLVGEEKPRSLKLY